ncbi:endonuclease/exonuclease/phosphatase family protein [Jiella sp. MQZ9-1]|uniref:Endonuclease/exonuclease/phosphatase family protein n=1 Tax=Jiella flava TaxID=2816857 RepID=A0A939G0P6_9HYPH|nr:endonuclease/exonuclease/phosphatase family protein [Jiella flava]MBO0662909.1 endonuclease/exonuclease/phosphatase family protein [Jiella flava]MCD2471331.1 endonuclease/exonuclease/phosphatase family protein [Jiella flava]
MLRVASYNIRKSVGTDWRRRPLEILAVLNEIDADVVALQEVDRRFGTRTSSIPPRAIRDHTRYTVVAVDARPGGIGWHGNAILVRETIAADSVTCLTLPALEPRGAVIADLRLGQARFRVAAMHLGLLGLWRKRQARAVLAALDRLQPALPTILMGDLNEWNPDGRCFKLFGRAHAVLTPGRSYPSRMPLGALDRIILSRDVELVDTAVHLSSRARRASDHLPVYADVAFAGSAAAGRHVRPLVSHP